jgi:hypothetical protein
MLEQGTRAYAEYGTEVQYSLQDSQSVYIEAGKVYSGTFAVSGALTGNEQSVMDSIAEQITYPQNNHEAWGICIPTYIVVDSASGTAYAEWKVDEAMAGSYRSVIAPIVLYIILAAVLAIVFVWLFSITIQKATEFVEASGESFQWVAIAGMLAAGAVVIMAAVYAYKNVVSDKPLMQHYNDYREERRQLND